MGNAGTEYVAFNRALRMGSFETACQIGRSLPRLDLDGALRLTLLAMSKAPDRYEALATRWIAKFIDEQRPNLEEVVWAAEVLRDFSAGDEQETIEALGEVMRLKVA